MTTCKTLQDRPKQIRFAKRHGLDFEASRPEVSLLPGRRHLIRDLWTLTE